MTSRELVVSIGGRVVQYAPPVMTDELPADTLLSSLGIDPDLVISKEATVHRHKPVWFVKLLARGRR